MNIINQYVFSWPAKTQRLRPTSLEFLSVGLLDKVTILSSINRRSRLVLQKLGYKKFSHLSEPRSLKILDLSQISCVTSLFLKLRPCMPCLWKARTLSAKQTGTKRGASLIALQNSTNFGTNCEILLGLSQLTVFKNHKKSNFRTLRPQICHIPSIN